MKDREDIIGQTFNRLTVKSYVGGKKYKYRCECICGRETEVPRDLLINGKTKSCGCLRKEIITKHGATVRDGSRLSATYRSWENMIGRCLNPNSKDYKNYGGRGITVCDEWLTFEGFYADMGDRPEGTTLGRRDNDGRYAKDNCRYETAKQQQRNTRKIVKLDSGETVASLSKKSNLDYKLISYRLWRGYSEEEARNTPHGKLRNSKLRDREDMIGKRNGRLVVDSTVRETVKDGKSRIYLNCTCDCGKTAKMLVGNFYKTSSCGCYRLEVSKEKIHVARLTRLERIKQRSVGLEE
jgi:hypothetical protein